MNTQVEESEEGSPWGKDYLVFALAGHECAADHSCMIETRRYDSQALLPLPAAPDYVCGSSVVEGAAVPVIDLGTKLGLTPSGESHEAAVFFAMIHAKVLGFVVSCGFDLTILQSWKISAALPAQLPFSGQYIEGIAQMGFRTLLLINLNSLFARDEVAQLVAKSM